MGNKGGRPAKLSEEEYNALPELVKAAYDGNKAECKKAVKRGSAIKQTDAEGRSALYWTASNGYIEPLRWLMKKGADLEAADPDGMTPLHKATINQHPECVEALLMVQGVDLLHPFVAHQAFAPISSLARLTQARASFP